MYFIVFIVIAIFVYVITFKDDFTAENMSKASPFLIFLVALLLLALIASAR